MGQYYRPCSVEKEKTVSPYAFSNGAKLMEHSYVGNNFVGAIEKLISKGGAWFGDKIVWGGDYADGEKDADGNTRTFKEDGKVYEITMFSLAKEIPYVDLMATLPFPKRKLRYLVNLDTQEFVDINKVPTFDDSWQIHPLPLMTCEGNGRGSGDFRGEDPNGLVGKWARNRVIMQMSKPKSCKEIEFDLVE